MYSIELRGWFGFSFVKGMEEGIGWLVAEKWLHYWPGVVYDIEKVLLERRESASVVHMTF